MEQVCHMPPNEGIAYSKRTREMRARFALSCLHAVAWELFAVRLLRYRYTLDRDVRVVCPECGRSLYAAAGMRYDGATFAPDLTDTLGRHSAAFPLHDAAWTAGTWESMEPISFDHNNAMMCHVLMMEGHPLLAVRRYAWGVSLPGMRKRWNKKHQPAPAHVHGSCRFVCGVSLALDGALRIENCVTEQ